jgi:hypothetical protein
MKFHNTILLGICQHRESVQQVILCGAGALAREYLKPALLSFRLTNWSVRNS